MGCRWAASTSEGEGQLALEDGVVLDILGWRKWTVRTVINKNEGDLIKSHSKPMSNPEDP